jgi:2-polyprenyl-6-methoxyphenol hydroxylase-like FAD-dependent oxidoreductase
MFSNCLSRAKPLSTLFPFPRHFSKIKKVPQVLVSGLSVEALALAMLLRNNGFVCEVVGKYAMHQLSRYKHGYVLYPPALNVLQKLGLSAPIEAASTPLHNHVTYHVNPRFNDSISFDEMYGESIPQSISKKALHEILAKAIHFYEIKIFNTNVSSFFQRDDDSKGVLAHFSDYRNPLYYDFLFDADEVKTNIRNQLIQPRVYHHTFSAISCVVKDIPDYVHSNDFVDVCAVESRVQIVPANNSGYIVTAYLNSQFPNQQLIPSSRPISQLLDHLEFIAPQLKSPLGQVIDSIKKEKIEKCHVTYPTEWRPTSLVKGRVALLGANAFSIPPLYGIEDTLGIENAWSLVNHLKEEGIYKRALKNYSQERLQRIESLSTASAEIHKQAQTQAEPSKSKLNIFANFSRNTQGSQRKQVLKALGQFS